MSDVEKSKKCYNKERKICVILIEASAKYTKAIKTVNKLSKIKYKEKHRDKINAYESKILNWANKIKKLYEEMLEVGTFPRVLCDDMEVPDAKSDLIMEMHTQIENIAKTIKRKRRIDFREKNLIKSIRSMGCC